jgi:hypothetical protein
MSSVVQTVLRDTMICEYSNLSRQIGYPKSFRDFPQFQRTHTEIESKNYSTPTPFHIFKLILTILLIIRPLTLVYVNWFATLWRI